MLSSFAYSQTVCTLADDSQGELEQSRAHFVTTAYRTPRP